MKMEASLPVDRLKKPSRNGVTRRGLERDRLAERPDAAGETAFPEPETETPHVIGVGYVSLSAVAVRNVVELATDDGIRFGIDAR